MSRLARVAVLLALATAVCLIANAVLFLPPIGTDSLIYHLTLPARWLQEGLYAPVDLPFHDGAAEHAPMFLETAAYFILYLTGEDGLTQWLQPLLHFAGAWCFYATLRLGSAGKNLSRLLVASLLIFPPFVSNAIVVNNDLLLVFGVALFSYGFMLSRWRKERGVPTALCGVAVMLGAKYLGVIYALAALSTLALYLIIRKFIPAQVAATTGKNRKALPNRPKFCSAVLWLIACGLLAWAGYFYLRNLFTFGNPFYPGTVRLLGIQLFPGLYDTGNLVKHGWTGDAFRKMFFHSSGDSFGLLWPYAVFLWGGFLAAAFTLIPRWKKETRRFCLACVFPATAIILFLLLVPYWYDQRHLLPIYYSLWLSAGIGLSCLCRRVPGKRAAMIRTVFQTVLAVLFLAQLFVLCVWLEDWFYYSLVIAIFLAWKTQRFNSKGKNKLIAATIAIGLALFVMGFFWHDYQSRRSEARYRIYAKYYCASGKAWGLIEQIRSASGKRLLIAYAGDAVMYPLYGRRLDNKVIYLPLSAGDQPQPVELQPGTGGGEMPEILAKARRKKVDAEYWRLQLENSGAEYLYLHDNPSRGGVSQELALIRSQPHRFQKLFAENGVYLFRFRR
jgi:hypothetical protein